MAVSTSINSVATITLHDYYKRYIDPDVKERAAMTVLYLSSLAFGVIGTGVALLMIKVQSALDAWWTLASVFSGGMLGLFLLGYFVRNSSRVPAIIAVAVGLLAIVWLGLSPVYLQEGEWKEFTSPFHSNLTIVIGTMVIFITGFLLTTIQKTKGTSVAGNDQADKTVSV